MVSIRAPLFKKHGLFSLHLGFSFSVKMEKSVILSVQSSPSLRAFFFAKNEA